MIQKENFWSDREKAQSILKEKNILENQLSSFLILNKEHEELTELIKITDEKYYRVDKDSLSIRFHDAETNEVIWYAFSRFSRAQAPKTQEEVDKLVRQAISKFNPGL